MAVHQPHNRRHMGVPITLPAEVPPVRRIIEFRGRFPRPHLSLEEGQRVRKILILQRRQQVAPPPT